ncbi:uncharacterized protein L969DRAFT_84646 [Mixia osmundae IAM 14324]|uniref:Xaa-Pro aminopeptidase P n=1 Tax=Mixia osmundae (strain CBS 9802 / IAM 14324 / JCM 22182 / KY 12970) TaxID=764103 RepID=G7DT24_MIXOS|nr:uncharacterized protein L969DRAFT_84646 [Mixia osmundae IAM 14324]KEI42763.1 hypothetical protein L969DRAFT_84646 [Mixia osmundae IAM 14324]GAA93903.1 hypothetical protein E5Q_00549 [Mixia osmundae IAM 14324]
MLRLGTRLRNCRSSTQASPLAFVLQAEHRVVRKPWQRSRSTGEPGSDSVSSSHYTTTEQLEALPASDFLQKDGRDRSHIRTEAELLQSVPRFRTVTRQEHRARIESLQRPTAPIDTMGAVVKPGGPVKTNDRIKALRSLLAQHALTAYVVPAEDAHASEYSCAADKRREFISGFSGSAGTVVVTEKEACLFTDGRYFLQASQQLDTDWTLMRSGEPDVPTWQEYLGKLPPNAQVGIDPTLISAADAKTISASLTSKSSQLVSLAKNLVDELWTDRPQRPENPLTVIPDSLAGRSAAEKIANMRKDLEKRKADALVVSMLDEVAWLFNLRGSDIPYNPVFFAYALVTPSEVSLFVDADKVPEEVKHELPTEVSIRPYDEIFSRLEGLASSLREGAKVVIGNKTSLALATAAGTQNVDIVQSPIAEAKAIKNEVELEGFRESHIRDGAALVAYFAWLEEQLASGAELKESAAADKLEDLRSKLPRYKGLSFTTISSTGPNAAIIHYSPDPESCATIDKDQIYLCDSGAQFEDGTTDVTRTLHFGKATDEERHAFTRVLQGHISIDSAVFPKGTTGYVLDAFARRALWADGLDYRHGTGHGVGHALNVHEGPAGIGTRLAYNETALKAGMVLSNEPGFYKDGSFGIRIENLVIVKDVKARYNFGNKGSLGFERITMCPIQTSLIDKSLLTPQEVQWVNEYHKEVLEKLSPLLKDSDPRAYKWLQRETKPF